MKQSIFLALHAIHAHDTSRTVSSTMSVSIVSVTANSSTTFTAFCQLGFLPCCSNLFLSRHVTTLFLQCFFFSQSEAGTKALNPWHFLCPFLFLFGFLSPSFLSIPLTFPNPFLFVSLGTETSSLPRGLEPPLFFEGTGTSSFLSGDWNLGTSSFFAFFSFRWQLQRQSRFLDKSDPTRHTSAVQAQTVRRSQTHSRTHVLNLAYDFGF